MKRGTVEKRNGQWAYRVSWRDDSGNRRHMRRQGFHTQKEALQALTAIQAQIDAGHSLGTAKGTVESYLSRWLDAYELSGAVKQSTRIATRSHVEKYLVPRLGKLQLRQLNASRISSFYVDLLRDGRTERSRNMGHDAGLSPKTVKNIAGTLHKALSDAVRLGVLTRNPSDGVDLPKWERPELRVWSVDELAQFLAHVEEHDAYGLAWWRLLLVAGLRRGELMGLTWEHVDLVDGVIHVRETRITTGGVTITETPKSKSGRRTVSVDAETVTALARLKNAQEDAADFLSMPPSHYVVSLLDGHLIGPSAISTRFRKMTTAAGLPSIRLHDARHTHVSQLIEAGVSLTAIAARVGHSRASFTLDTYGHLMPNADRHASDTVAQLLAVAMDVTRRTPSGRRMDAELAEHDMNDATRDNVKPLQMKETATGRHDEMERVTGIEPVEPPKKRKRNKGHTTD
jgi:integrase